MIIWMSKQCSKSTTLAMMRNKTIEVYIKDCIRIQKQEIIGELILELKKRTSIR